MIQDLRDRIDALDDALVELLAHRLALASEIGRIKAQTRQEIFDAKREEAILRRLKSKDLIPDLELEKIYAVIFGLTKDIQEEK